MSRTPLETTTLQPDKNYTFYLVDSTGCIIETLPDEHHAQTVLQFYIEQGRQNLHIEVEHKPRMLGLKTLGRDPDLH
tara:strand:- start:196 stop:426 length:231 start_codon:yes stop_codon:yes gene_type:complete